MKKLSEAMDSLNKRVHRLSPGWKSFLNTYGLAVLVAFVIFFLIFAGPSHDFSHYVAANIWMFWVAVIALLPLSALTVFLSRKDVGGKIIKKVQHWFRRHFPPSPNRPRLDRLHGRLVPRSERRRHRSHHRRGDVRGGHQVTADLYDQDADHTPPHGIERPTVCPKGCPAIADSDRLACLHPRTCPLGVEA